MALTPIEVIATIFALFALLKLIVVVINKNSWHKNVANPIFKNSSISIIIFVILGIIVFYYLLQELSVIQIFAVVAFTSLLIGIGFLQHAKELIPVLKNAYSKKF